MTNTSASLINDNPIGDGKPLDDDCLNFSIYANVLSEKIASTPDNISIGIFGEWGTGKTSLMHIVEEALSKEGIETLKFNAWQHESENIPIASLARKTIKHLKKLEEKDSRIKSTTNYLSNILSNLSYSGKVSLPGVEIEASSKTKDKTMADLLDETEIKKEKIKFKFIILIDDLDRCFPDNAIKILEAIKLVYSSLGFSFIIGVSRKVVEGYLNHRYKEEYGIIDFNGASYLDKIIQLSFYIPPNHNKINQLSDGILERLPKPTKEKIATTLPLIARSLNANPRSLVRFTNSLIINSSITEKLNTELPHIDIGYFAISSCLRLLWPKTLDILISNPSICLEISTWNYDDLYKNTHSEEILLSEVSKTLASESNLYKLLLETEQGKLWLTEHSFREASSSFYHTPVMEPARQNLADDALKNYDAQLIYTRFNSDKIHWIKEELTKNGISISVEQNSLKSTLFIIAIGKDSRTSEYISNVYGKINGMGIKVIIPLLLPGSTKDDLPDFLKGVTFIDLGSGIDKKKIKNLANQIKYHS